MSTLKGKPQFDALLSMARSGFSRTIISQRIFCAVLTFVLLVVYGSHRYAAHKMNTRTFFKSPISDLPRECPPPTYDLLDPKSVDPKKICITTLTDEKNADALQRLVRWRNFNNLLQMTWPNKQAYAAKHGYSLFDESDSLDTSRPPSWSKIRAAQRLLQEEDCEWVVWWDADTVIMNSEKRIQDFLPASKDLLLTEQKGGSYNAGAWIIKKSEWSLHFLDHWWNMQQFVHPKGMSTSGDNAALKSYLVEHNGMTQGEFDAHIGVPPRCTFNSVTVFLSPAEYAQAKKTAPEQLEWYHHPEKYHKGDLIAHIAGKNNKIDTTAMMLKDAV